MMIREVGAAALAWQPCARNWRKWRKITNSLRVCSIMSLRSSAHCPWRTLLQKSLTPPSREQTERVGGPRRPLKQHLPLFPPSPPLMPPPTMGDPFRIPPLRRIFLHLLVLNSNRRRRRRRSSSSSSSKPPSFLVTATTTTTTTTMPAEGGVPGGVLKRTHSSMQGRCRAQLQHKPPSNGDEDPEGRAWQGEGSSHSFIINKLYILRTCSSIPKRLFCHQGAL